MAGALCLVYVSCNIPEHLRTFSRQSNSEFIPVDVNQTIEDCLLMVSEQLWGDTG